MEKYDWNDITGRLTRLLRPQTTPVGMKWVRTEEDLRAIPKVRIHDKHLPPCTIVSHAAQFNWTSACRAENVHANYCRGINGMFAPDEKWYSGKMFENVWYDNLDASKAHNRALDCVPPEYVALVASPLTAGRIEPDVCVLYLSPAQAFLFLAGTSTTSTRSWSSPLWGSPPARTPGCAPSSPASPPWPCPATRTRSSPAWGRTICASPLLRQAWRGPWRGWRASIRAVCAIPSALTV